MVKNPQPPTFTLEEFFAFKIARLIKSDDITNWFL
jgi:hypothetical protein